MNVALDVNRPLDNDPFSSDVSAHDMTVSAVIVLPVFMMIPMRVVAIVLVGHNRGACRESDRSHDQSAHQFCSGFHVELQWIGPQRA